MFRSLKKSDYNYANEVWPNYTRNDFVDRHNRSREDCRRFSYIQQRETGRERIEGERGELDKMDHKISEERWSNKRNFYDPVKNLYIWFYYEEWTAWTSIRLY